MPKRTCCHCGADISSLHANRRYCSTVCQAAKKYLERPRIPCAECGEATGYMTSRPPAKPPKCRACRRLTHGTLGAYQKRGCRCTECRRANAVSGKDYAGRRRAAGNPVPPNRSTTPAICAQCGEPFSRRADTPERKFCSRTCVGTSQRKAMDVTKTPPRWKAAKRALRRAAHGTTGKGRVWVQGPCLSCGESFAPSPGAASRYCSADCRAVIRRMGAGWAPRELRLTIYRAAKWRCEICGEKMSPTYSRRDPWSPTLDHITPRSLGGSDDPSNLRAAHMWCNAVRGDLAFYTDSDLQVA